MNTDHLAYFLAICEEQSTNRAAEKLYISPQGLGKAVRQLESHLGAALFEGEGDNRRLTEYGEVLRLHAVRIMNEQRRLEERFAEINAHQAEVVKVAFSYGVLGSLGVSFIEDFAFSHQGVRATYAQVPDYECDRMLLEREVDVGFTVGPYNEGLQTWELRREESCLWMSADSELAAKPVLDVSDLRGQRVVMIGKGLKMHETLPCACRALGFELDIAFATPELGMIKQLAGRNGLVSLTVGHETADLPEGVVSRPIAGIDWRYGVSTVAGRPLSAAQQEFVDYACGYVK